jgi:NAD(P)-dependent dehydrogenase (short-subunit alcohol dehydrogenase family)
VGVFRSRGQTTGSVRFCSRDGADGAFPLPLVWGRPGAWSQADPDQLGQPRLNRDRWLVGDEADRDGRELDGPDAARPARQPDDIAPIVVFLASDDARWVTGDVIVASGGLR